VLRKYFRYVVFKSCNTWIELMLYSHRSMFKLYNINTLLNVSDSNSVFLSLKRSQDFLLYTKKKTSRVLFYDSVIVIYFIRTRTRTCILFCDKTRVKMLYFINPNTANVLLPRTNYNRGNFILNHVFE